MGARWIKKIKKPPSGAYSLVTWRRRCHSQNACKPAPSLVLYKLKPIVTTFFTTVNRKVCNCCVNTIPTLCWLRRSFKSVRIPINSKLISQILASARILALSPSGKTFLKYCRTIRLAEPYPVHFIEKFVSAVWNHGLRRFERIINA